MLSVSAFSFLHQFIICQSRPLPICSVEGECWGREKCEDQLCELTNGLMPAGPSGSCYLLSGNCEVCVGNIHSDATVFKSDLRDKSPNLLMTWREEPRQQHEHKGLLIPTWCPCLRCVWAKYCSTGGQPLNQIGVCLLKGYCIPNKGNLKISFNSLLGSKKHLSKRKHTSRTKCSIQKLKEQNAAYSGFFLRYLDKFNHPPQSTLVR